MHHLSITTKQQHDIIDITDELTQYLPEGAGTIHVFIRHTTAAITTADLDPGMADNMTKALWEMVPKLNYQHHDPGHTPSHILASLIGPDVNVPFDNGRLQLGTWQRIVVVEFDGPKARDIILTTFQEAELSTETKHEQL